MGPIHPGDQDDNAPASRAAEAPAERAASVEQPAPGTAPAVSLTSIEKVVAGAGVLAGALLTVLLLLTRTGASAGPSADPVPALKAEAPVSTDTAADAVPAWTDANHARWVGSSRRAVAYDVAADAPVSVWMRTVRPALVVRCEGSELEVFVFTGSSARIEPGTPDHTVRVQFDDGEEESALWPDADAHDALFAPDGALFARRLAKARTLRFGFTPHNAEPVTARFAVAGLEPLLARAAKDGCKAALR